MEGGAEFVERLASVPDQLMLGFARLLTPGAEEHKGEFAQQQRKLLEVARDPTQSPLLRTEAFIEGVRMQPGVLVEETVVRPLQQAPGKARSAGVHLAQAETATSPVEKAVHLLAAVKDTSEAFTGIAAPFALMSGRPASAANASNEALALRSVRTGSTAAEPLTLPAPSASGRAGLRILNPEFTPDPTRVLQNITKAQADALAANPALARTVLSRREYLAGQRSEGIARLQYGNAVERLVAEEIAESPLHSRLLEHFGGPNSPDFVGRGVLRYFGEGFEITTPGQIPAHVARPYGPGLNFATYQRPPSFRLFP